MSGYRVDGVFYEGLPDDEPPIGQVVTTEPRTEPDGEGGVRHVYDCSTCNGTGEAVVGGELVGCPDCEGLGGWFE